MKTSHLSSLASRRFGETAVVLAILAFLPAITSAQSDEPSPFSVTPATLVSNGATYLSLSFHVPAHHHIYADRLYFEANGAPANLSLPAPEQVADRFSR